jgi:diguanylate cyclase (GGDEF)-like protein/PAS domain S-box-containing protein
MPRLARLFLLCLFLPAAALAGEALTLGIFAYRPKAVMEEKFGPLAGYLTGALPDGRVELEILDQKEMEAALAANRLDFVFTNPSHFVLLRHMRRLSGAVATMQANEDGATTDLLGGAVLVPAGKKDMRGLADLRGKRIAIPGSKFLGGYQTQAYELLLAGVRLPDDVELIEVGSHDKVVETLLAGAADAGFVRTGILEAMTREGKLPAGRLEVLDRKEFPGFPYAVSTRLYPEWAFAALPHVPEDAVKRVTRALLFMTPDMPAAQSAGIAGFTIPGDYYPVDMLARALRLPPYESADFDWADVWRRYRWTLVVALAAFGLILALSARLYAGNRRQRREQEKLVASERRLALTVESADLGTWEWHLPSGRVDFNERLVRMLGHAPGELAPHVSSWEQLIHPADQARVRENLDAHLAGATPRYVCPHRLQHKEGRWVWVLDAGQVVERAADGAAVRMQGIHLDITDSKEAEAALRAREQHLSTLLASMDDVVIVIDTAGRIADCHWPAGDARAPAADAWRGRECDAVLPKSLAEMIGEIMGELILAPARPLHREFEWPLDGRARWFSATFSALKDADEPYPRGFLCVARDVTARKEEEAALARSRAEIERLSRRNQLLLDAAGEGIYGVDAAGDIEFINPSALAMLGLTEAEALGRNSHELFHDRRLDGAHYPAEECPLYKTLRDGERRETEEVFVRRNGEPFFVHLVTTPVVDAGRQVGAEVVFLDISARKAMEAELTHLATIDALTGVANRRHFMELAEVELARVQRFEQPAALLMLDLDHFKRVNDTHGHAAGDAVLAAFADTLRGALRKIDHVGRLGGEEFAVLLPGAEREAAVAFAERVRKATLVRTVRAGESAIIVTVSIGVAILRAADANPDAALARADAALYRAKTSGRNRIEVETD